MIKPLKPGGYHARVIDRELDELLAGLPAIAIDGAKGVGKTETAGRRVEIVHALDDPVQLELARADEAFPLDGRSSSLIDEWQRLPHVWDRVRRAVDRGAPPGRFLLTGSASPVVDTHSGAGRIVRIRMRPLSLAERIGLESSTVSLAALLTGRRPPVEGETAIGLADYGDEIVRSGFPGIRGYEGRRRRQQLDGYLTNIVEREFPDLGHTIRNPAALRRWLTAYAAASSTSASFEKIRDAATSGSDDKPAKSTTLPYRDVLERLWILDPVEAWMPTHNRIARLSHPPKHQLADPALAARLLGVEADTLLTPVASAVTIPRDGSLVGALFESLVTQSVRVYAQQAEARVGHLRTKSGAREIDLIVERADGRVVAIEVKLTQTPDDNDLRHLHWLSEQLGADLLDSVVITTGRYAYRRQDGIAVVPAALLGP